MQALDLQQDQLHEWLFGALSTSWPNKLLTRFEYNQGLLATDVGTDALPWRFTDGAFETSKRCCWSANHWLFRIGRSMSYL